MPLCKIDYERSSVQEYKNTNDAGHKYLHLTMVPTDMGLIQQAFMGNMSEYVINIFPKRKSDMTIDEDFEKALIDAFNNKQLQNTMVDRVEVEIPDTWMTYSNGERRGQIITDQATGQRRVYKSVQLICVMKKKADESGWEPSIPLNRLKQQALRMREQRINSDLWFNATSDVDPIADNANVLTPTEDLPPMQPQQPIQPVQPQPQPQPQPVRPQPQKQQMV